MLNRMLLSSVRIRSMLNNTSSLVWWWHNKRLRVVLIDLPQPLPMALVLRSLVAPLRCQLSYTDAKVVTIFVIHNSRVMI